jgi:uncharacterized protein
MSVRVLAVSDEVDERLATGLGSGRPVDLVLACGDLPADYLAALMNALDVPLVFVPGNHDPDLSGYRRSRTGLITLAGFPAVPPWPPGSLSADGHVVDVAGLRVAGLGGCLRYGPGANQYPERQQARSAWRLRHHVRRCLASTIGRSTCCSRMPRPEASATPTTCRTGGSAAISGWLPTSRGVPCWTVMCTRA